MSFGDPESSGEVGADETFATPSGHEGVTFLAAAGDYGAPGFYPAYSPNVVAVGGTSLSINADNTYAGETAWSGGGGGVSQYEAEPIYQASVQDTGYRTIPDVAFDADPNTGVIISNSFVGLLSSDWSVVGGTSLGTPCWAGLIALVNQGRVAAGGATLNSSSPNETLTALYDLPSSDFNDDIGGNNGTNTSGLIDPARYNEATGLGSPIAGNLVPALISYGLSGPAVWSVTPASGVATGGTKVTITGINSAPGDGVMFGDTPAGDVTYVSNTEITAVAPVEGTMAATVDVTVTTADGDSATSSADQFTYEGAPAVTAIGPASGPLTGGALVTITGANLTDATAVNFGLVAATSFRDVSATEIEAYAPAGSAGTVDIEVASASGTSAASSADKFTYDGIPAVNSVVPSTSAFAGSAVTITGTNLANAKAVNFGSVVVTNFASDSATKIVVTCPEEVAGTVDVTVATPGGTSAISLTDEITFGSGAAPTVSSVAPVQGSITGGTSVTIVGSNFSAGSKVTFGVVAASDVTIVSCTEIVAVTPDEGATAATVAVTVTTSDGTSTADVSDDFTYQPSPNVAAISPALGALTGGVYVTITGTHLAGAMAVYFGSIPAIYFHNVSSKEVEAYVPTTDSAGAVNVTVVTAGGTSATSAADEFTYLPAPVVMSLSSATGNASGGTPVTIAGTDLLDAIAVDFGSIVVTSFTSDTAGQLVVTSPAGEAGTVDVTVVTAGGASAPTPADQFTFGAGAAPTVESISTSSGPMAGSTTVTIDGTNFAGTPVVDFGAAQATIVSFTTTQIVAVSPAASAPGAVDVTVIDTGGDSTKSPADQFTYVTPQTIGSISPSLGPLLGGSAVTIMGSNLLDPTAVVFGSTPAKYFLSVSAAEIIAYCPGANAGAVDVQVTTVGGESALSPADQFIYVAPPTFTNAGSAVFTVGKSGSFTFTTTSDVAAALAESGLLPVGVTFTDNGDGSATLSGSPAAYSGAFIFDVTANNGVAAAVTQVFTLTVVDPPIITSAGAATFAAGKAAGFSVTTTAGLPAATTLTERGALPKGVTFVVGKNGTAKLSGSPAPNTGGTYDITISASNGAGSTASQYFTLTVDQTPAFSTAGTAIFSVGQPGSFTVTTTGYPIATMTQSGIGLPDWLAFTDNDNGTITLNGTPPTASLTPINFTIMANNGALPSVTQSFMLYVDQAPTITSADEATFTVGKAGSLDVIATAGLPAKTTFSVSGKLPAGVSINATTGVLGGKPAAGTGGTYDFDIIAASSADSTDSQPFTLTVDQAPAITSAKSAIFSVGQPGSFTVTTTGFPVASISESDLTLPNWLTFTDNHNGTATLSGTPQVGSDSLTPIGFTITAANGALPNVTQAFKLSVDLAPAITSADSATFIVGEADTFDVKATAGLPTKTTYGTSGKLPAGVSINAATGVLGGKPAAGSGGTYDFDIIAASSAGSTDSQPFTLTVDQAPAVTSASSTIFSVGQPDSFTVKTTGYPTAAITDSGPALPDWLTFTDNHNGTATLSGTPSSASLTPIEFTITANNSALPNATKAFKLYVDQAPTITSADEATFTEGKAESFGVKATAGLPAKTTFTVSGRLPAGVSINPTTGVLSGKPVAGSGGTYDFDIIAASSADSTDSQPFTLTVDQSTAITSADSAVFNVAQSGSFTIRTTGFPVAALTEKGALPAGVTFVDNGSGTATLSGIPLAETGGKYLLTLTATVGSTSVSQTFTLTVNEPPVITSANIAVFDVGQSNSFTITASGFPEATTITEIGALPSGITFVDKGNGTAVLSGKPTSPVAFLTFTIVVSNGVSPESIELFTLDVML